MKNIALLVVIILSISNMELYSNDKVKLIFKNGYEISGEIIDTIPGDSIRFKHEDLPIMSFRNSDISVIEILKKKVQKELFDTNGTVGIGIGINYGFNGLCVELNIPFDNTSVFAGLGFSDFSKMGWGIGCRYYFTDYFSSFQPRIALHIGTNNIILIETRYSFSYENKKEFETGIGADLGAGFKWMFGETNDWGIDFDIYYILYSSVNERIDEFKRKGYKSISDEKRTVAGSLGVIIPF